MTGSIQLALADTGKAQALLSLLSRSTPTPVECVESPRLTDACVVVVDAIGFARLPAPLTDPDRVVLISRGDPASLKEAWDAGVNSVVSDGDPLNTLVLAILSACLRAGARPARTAPAVDDRSRGH